MCSSRVWSRYRSARWGRKHRQHSQSGAWAQGAAPWALCIGGWVALMGDLRLRNSGSALGNFGRSSSVPRVPRRHGQGHTVCAIAFDLSHPLTDMAGSRRRVAGSMPAPSAASSLRSRGYRSACSSARAMAMRGSWPPETRTRVSSAQVVVAAGQAAIKSWICAVRQAYTPTGLAMRRGWHRGEAILAILAVAEEAVEAR
jgi:hypothetical protein